MLRLLSLTHLITDYYLFHPSGFVRISDSSLSSGALFRLGKGRDKIALGEQIGTRWLGIRSYGRAGQNPARFVYEKKVRSKK